MQDKAKRVAILQSNYIPWRGYFDLIDKVDCFIIYDEMQYTRRDWRNRNKIKTVQGEKWLSVPVRVKGKYTQKISETAISDTTWAESHWNKLHAAYAQSEAMPVYGPIIKAWYEVASTFLPYYLHVYM